MRARFLIGISQIALVLFVLTTGLQADVNSYDVNMSPAERHRIMAEAKVKAFDRREMRVTPSSVLDVSGYNAVYYKLDLQIDEVARWVEGEVTMHAVSQAAAYASPTLNLRNAMIVDSVKSGGQAVAWSHASHFLYVTLNSPVDVGEVFDLTIWYQGLPEAGGFQGFSFSSHSGIPVISTLSEPYLAQSWWPCKDTPSDKCDSADIIMTVNSAFYAVSNGVLRDSVDNGDGTTTYSWHEGYPITTYLISLAISQYSRFDLWYHYGPGDLDSMPVRFYAYPDRFTGAQAAWPVTVDQIAFFADQWGEYPFVEEKYGMAHFNWGGAMEHQTVTSAYWGDFGFSQFLVAHELAHQWWGDLITCRDWHHIWLNEGFASYAEALWQEHQLGAAAYRSYMVGMNYFSGGRIYVDDTTSVGSIFSSRVYDKGAWVLHMLRGVVGDADFFTILRDYYNSPAHRYGTAVTEDFQAICEAVSGLDLNAFFQDWIYGYYYPKYALSWMAEPRSEDNFYNIYVHIRQFQATSPQAFHMPIELQLSGAPGNPVYRVDNTQREQDFLIIAPDPPLGITLDPNNWILDTHTDEPYTMHLLTETLLPGIQFGAYAESLIVKGGTPPYDFQVVSGSLPGGLTLEAASGKITGAPSEAGDFSLTIGVWDQGDVHYSEKALTVSIIDTPYLPGDLNSDLLIDPLDLNAMIDYLFYGAPPPFPVRIVDVNSDCQADPLDLNILIDYLFFNGPDLQPGCIL